MTIPESVLLDQAGQYEAASLAEIYDRHSGAIYRYLYRYLGNAAQAEDLTSDVFLKLLQVLGTRRAPRENLRGWLYRVAHNMAMDWFRQQARRGSISLDENMPAGDASPSAQAEAHIAREQVRASIRLLAPDQQQVILLRFAEGCTIAEVAETLGKSEGAIKSLQHRAVKRLQKLLATSEGQSHEPK